jgi:hypothetical protein
VIATEEVRRGLVKYDTPHVEPVAPVEEIAL